MELYSKTDLDVLSLLGQKVKEIRLEQNITQSKLAELSGVSLRRVGDVESGENHSVLILIQILRALRSLELLSNFFTEKQISPIEYAKLQGSIKKKQRARSVTIKEEDEQW
ncbi:MAG: helix-turn-helix domain-containing protein [Rikenellaceae bacterium]